MLNIPNWADHHVMLSQYTFDASSAKQFERTMNDAFAAEQQQITVTPCRHSGKAGGKYFNVLTTTFDSVRFRNKLLPEDRWAVMYCSQKTRAVFDVTDAWLRCFNKEFEAVSPGYVMSLMATRRSCNLLDGPVDPNVSPAPLRYAMASAILTAPRNLKAFTPKFPPTEVLRRSLADPSNVEGCAGVNSKRDAILRKMFG